MTSHIGKYIFMTDNGGLDSTLIRLYGEADIPVQRQRYLSLLRRMEAWAQSNKCIMVNVPGRTELGGNHTDHNNGVVLAAAVHFDCLAVAAPTKSNVIRIRSTGFADTIEVELDDYGYRLEEEGTSTALVRGIAHAFTAAGYKLGALDACVDSEVPVGAGLSSSAAFEVCVGQMFNQLFNHGDIPAIELARIGRTAENYHFGKPCGFMDQIACAVQGILSIDFADQENPEVNEVDFDFSSTDYQLVVVDTGGDHADLTPEYAAIPDEMTRAAKVLGHDTARGLSIDQVLDRAAEIRRLAGDRSLLRLIHFIMENDRAKAQAKMLNQGNMAAFLKLVAASGDSSWRLLQNCVSTTNYAAQPIPVALTLTEHFLEGEGAWRIQGGGFAGTIQAYVPKERLAGYCQFMEDIYGRGAVLPLRVRKPGDELIIADRSHGMN